MLFGEIGLPDQVENISASGSRRLTRARQSAVSLMACARDALRIHPWPRACQRIRSRGIDGCSTIEPFQP
jgi:hypothetical protein